MGADRCVHRHPGPSHSFARYAASVRRLTGLRKRHIVNYMVKHQHTGLDHVFAALADPTRRALITQLSERKSASISDLARPFPMSLPAIMKHLDVLTDAALISRTKTGRTVICSLTAAPMEQAMGWLRRYERFWSEQLDRLAAYVEEESCRANHPSAASLVSRSSAASTPRRRSSLEPGRSRKK
ncbi:MAG TPA: metalloregulator ArsR/SmtB family transcription factor [Methylocella sp.]